MSKTKSNLHTIICDYVPLYDYRGEVLFYKDFGKNKGINKKEFRVTLPKLLNPATKRHRY